MSCTSNKHKSLGSTLYSLFTTYTKNAILHLISSKEQLLNYFLSGCCVGTEPQSGEGKHQAFHNFFVEKYMLQKHPERKAFYKN